VAFEFVEEPRPTVGSIIVGRALGDAESLGRFLEGEADKVTQLDQGDTSPRESRAGSSAPFSPQTAV